MASHGKRSAAEVVRDERVSDFYGYPRELSECMGFPKSGLGLIRDRIREERDRRRKLAALMANPVMQGEKGLRAYCSQFVDWDAVMREEVKVTDDQALHLGAFLVLTKDGSLEVDPSSGWPVHWSYCGLAQQLHAFSPARFRNGEGRASGQQTVKGKVVIAFAKKLHAYLERVTPNVWPFETVKSGVENEFGDDSHRVPHCAKKK